MGFTFRLKNSNEKDLAGFINILTKNGYEVNLRTGGTAHLMADIESGEAKIREIKSSPDFSNLMSQLKAHEFGNPLERYLTPRNVAAFLITADDEEFATTFAYFNKLLNETGCNTCNEKTLKILANGLEEGDMTAIDPAAIGKHIANILSEIIFDKNIDADAWWKEGEKDAE